MRWKELTNLNSIRRLLSALSALLNKRVMTWMLQKKKPAVLKLQFIFKMQKRLFFWGGRVVKCFHFPHLEIVVMCCCCTAPEYLKSVCALGRNVRLYKAHWHMHIDAAPTRYFTALSFWVLGEENVPWHCVASLM